MTLPSSISNQNVFFTYVCFVNEVRLSADDRYAMKRAKKAPSWANNSDTDEMDTDEPIRVERSKALHEIVRSHRNKKKYIPNSTVAKVTESTENLESSNKNNTACVTKSSILKLTKVKWLTENQCDASESSSPSISTSSSSTKCSEDSECPNEPISSGDKCLSTILRLDKEHNIFGLSNIAIVGQKFSKKKRKENEKPVFPQTAIVQVCSIKKCCKHKSNTDLPISLKCGACHSCCFDPFCSLCAAPRVLPSDSRPCSLPCSSSCKIKYSCKVPYIPSKCMFDCTTRYGMKILLKRKPKYEPSPIELTPRSSCVLSKPIAARSCHHTPQCIPPSSCFPYQMPCYWPVRVGAPCSHPSRCFHNPPCLPPRRKKPLNPVEEMCPKTGCVSEIKNSKCPNMACPGKTMKEAIENRFGNKSKRK